MYTQSKVRSKWPKPDAVKPFKVSRMAYNQMPLPGMGRRLPSEAEALKQADEMLERLFASDLEPGGWPERD